jgi:feruloyl-CoA synthase
VAATAEVEDAHARVGADTVAKVLFTSGSTGTPKGVINTQRMLTANQEQLRTVLAFLGDAPPVLCDWLPWNHTFGGNHNFGLTLYNGGTLYIDGGTPTPAGFATTAANLREIATTAYFNVPRGYDLLLQALRGDAYLRSRFFSRVQILFYAAAGLRQEVSDAIDRLALDTCGERIPWVTGLGATETAPFAICTGALPAPVSGRVGVPAPGVELKLEPVGGLFEARVRGPNVTPGYWADPALTAAAFDGDGFYAMGDALGFVDPDDPARGFTFQGRIAEDFKLTTGTWVRVGPLRAALLAALGEVAQDIVIAAPGRDDVRVLVFPNLAACRRLAAKAAEAPAAEVLDAAAVRDRFAAALSAFSAAQAGSSMRVVRALLLTEPPSIDGGELTDKGSINQKAVLRRRAVLVDALYARSPAALTIDITERTTTA